MYTKISLILATNILYPLELEMYRSHLFHCCTWKGLKSSFSETYFTIKYGLPKRPTSEQFVRKLKAKACIARKKDVTSIQIHTCSIPFGWIGYYKKGTDIMFVVTFTLLPSTLILSYSFTANKILIIETTCMMKRKLGVCETS